LEKTANEELHNLKFSRNIIYMIKSNEEACSMQGKDEKFITSFSWRNQNGRGHLEEPSAFGKITLRRILKKQGGRRVRNDSTWFRIGKSGGCMFRSYKRRGPDA
jgi:hypothetical protein